MGDIFQIRPEPSELGLYRLGDFGDRAGRRKLSSLAFNNLELV